MRDDDRARLVRLLKLHEGVRLRPYDDGYGNVTIGYGRNLSANGITRAEAELFLAHDLAEAERQIRLHYPWTDRLDAVRFAALVDLGFNLGPTRLAAFKQTLRAFEMGHYDAASRQLLHSLWARQVPSRAARIAEMIRTGFWPTDLPDDTP